MVTKVDKDLKRELLIRDNPFTLTIGPERLKLTPKGHRNGLELRLEDLVDGDAALAAALNASINPAR
jgi:hypothetical protein